MIMLPHRVLPLTPFCASAANHGTGLHAVTAQAGSLCWPDREGLRLLPRARAVLTAAEIAYQSAKGPKLSGRITVGIMEDLSARRLPLLLALFQQTYPDVDVEVTSDLSMHLDGLISRKKLDLAIVKRIHVPNNRSKNDTSLFVEPLRWVGGTNGALGRDASVPLVLFPDGCEYRQQLSAP